MGMNNRSSLVWFGEFASKVGPYFLTTLLVAGTTALLFYGRKAVLPSIVGLLYLLPVGLSAVWWGLGAGILSAFLAFLAFNYFFIEPYYTLLVHQTQDLLGLVVFLCVAVVISQLVGRTRRSLAAATAREREVSRLYELSQSLSGLQEEKAIAQAIALKIRETFQAECVAVVIEMRQGEAGVLRVEEGRRKEEEPTVIVPLQSTRGLLGEARVWQAQRAFSAEEERLLSTFANQGALALERARLTQAETRARVLEESDRLKSALLSSVSHELRTPLATIKAAVSSLHGRTVEWESEARTELLAAIEEETDQLDRLVGNLLNMTRIEAGALQLQRRWNHLGEIASGVVGRIRHRQNSTEASLTHRIELDIPEELPLAPVDYVLMEQVFNNLISNGLKYSPANTTIKICARQMNKGGILVEVGNQGPNVPEEDLERIFDKFHRVTATDRVTGAGLGLSICKGIVEAHGGRIWAENLPGGFVFKFILPLIYEGVAPAVTFEENLNN